MSARGSIRMLQIVLGVVLCFYGTQLVLGQLHSAHHLHTIFLATLGAAEAVAAVVFVCAARAGGRALLVVFAFAALFHVLRGDFGGLGVLAVYAAGVLAVMNSIPD